MSQASSLLSRRASAALSPATALRVVSAPAARTAPRPQPDAAVAAMILAGGRGERLHPLTVDRAKPAVPFGGAQRIIDFTIANCVRSRIDRIHVLTQYRAESIEQQLPRIPAIDVLRADPATGGYRGTADAVRRHLARLGTARIVVVLGGDHVYSMDYRDVVAAHAASGAEVTIAATEVSLADARRMGVMRVDGEGWVRGFAEKPQSPEPMPGRPGMALASMGIYVFSRDALVRELERAHGGRDDFGRDVLPEMVGGGARVLAFPFRDRETGEPSYWRDIGTLDSYFDAHMDLAAGRVDLGLRALRGCGGSSRSVIAPLARIDASADVSEAVLLGRVEVGPGARIRRAVLDENVRVAPRATIGVDEAADRSRFTVTERGVVVVPRGTTVEA